MLLDYSFIANKMYQSLIQQLLKLGPMCCVSYNK